ncbi:MAG: GNAT family N-acetyltransferase [Actinomycetia bacterium]|nr:GNAT family N-acetyltransferase [Actinomycetes bacterium]
MTLNNDWKSFPTDLAPLAENVGPFPQRPFLEALWHHRADQNAELHIEASTSGATAVVVSEGLLTFAGRSDLTDYHAPVGQDGTEALVRAVGHFPDMPFRFDSLPLEAVDPIVAALSTSGVETVVSEDEVVATISLPPTYDDWLASLSKKQRHEVRRKRRRFEAEFGLIDIERHESDAIDVFCTMHRLSVGEKGQFMTGAMEELFRELLLTAGASIHLLTCDGVARAAAFGFEADNGYYYYNSAYDPAAAMASPGIVLFSAMIETEIDRGAVVFDFLKGDEQYKFRHGAEPRQLFAIEGRTP